MSSDESYRNPNAERTETLLAALNMLRCTNFRDKYMASAIRITLRTLDGKCLTPDFAVAGEDMELIKAPIVESLRASLKMRVLLLRNEIAEIEEALV